MDYTQLTTLKWISVVSAAVTIAGAISPLDPSLRRYLLASGGIMVFLFIAIEVQKDRLSVLFSGTSRYYREFPTERNAEVLQKVEAEYCYLGISFTSVAPQFRRWFEAERRANVRVRILLLDPDAGDVLDYQARYQLGLFGNDLNAEQRQQVAVSAQSTKKAIAFMDNLLRSLPDSSSHIEVRYHREKLRKWMHRVDGKELYLGMLQKGANGLCGPVMVLRKRTGVWSLYDHHDEEFESLWASAAPVARGSREPGVA